jgi:RNA polymerase sigma-70 factor (ECF subfamily)
MKEFEGRLIRYSSKMTNLEVGREVVQETFLRLWQEDPQKLAGREMEWLFCVCRNLSLDHLKKEKRLQPFDKDIKSDNDDPEKKIAKQQTETKINQLINTLPPVQQEVLRLKFQEGLSYEKISLITGHTPSYVGVLIHSAMSAIRSQVRGGVL